MLAYLRLVYRLPLLLLHLLLGTPVTVVTQYRPFRDLRLGGRPLSEVTAVLYMRTICRLFGLHIEQIGAVGAGARLLVANHISWLDIPLINSMAAVSFVSKAEINDWPVIGLMARSGRTVFHQRGSHDSASGVATVMAERLAAGGRVAIFPEGGIRPGHGVKRFHGRMFAAAIDSGAPVQPVMLRYLRDGGHDPDMTFLPGEHFVGNFFRLLRQGPCTAHVEVLPELESTGRQRRELAAQAEAAVRAAFEADIARS
ncbi:MAG: lysophospholipid acyltransferase family protein [Xanthomonadales bacterium]